MTISAEQFRQGMRQFPAGVSIIATRMADGTRTGLTATAICSLSAEPPSLLCCVNQLSGSLVPIREAGIFSVNMLSADQQDLSTRFASPGDPEEKFHTDVWETLETGAPILKNACISFDCALDQVINVNTHSIIIGQIVAVVGASPEVAPLLYLGGQYGAFTPL